MGLFAVKKAVLLPFRRDQCFSDAMISMGFHCPISCCNATYKDMVHNIDIRLIFWTQKNNEEKNLVDGFNNK